MPLVKRREYFRAVEDRTLCATFSPVVAKASHHNACKAMITKGGRFGGPIAKTNEGRDDAVRANYTTGLDGDRHPGSPSLELPDNGTLFNSPLHNRNLPRSAPNALLEVQAPPRAGRRSESRACYTVIAPHRGIAESQSTAIPFPRTLP